MIVSLLAGRFLIDRIFERVAGEAGSAPGRLLSLVILLALVGAAATQAIGIHAVFGGFVVA